MGQLKTSTVQDIRNVKLAVFLFLGTFFNFFTDSYPRIFYVNIFSTEHPKRFPKTNE